MATIEEKQRFENIKASGCICCLLVHRMTQAPDIHHLTSGSRRRGHMDTIGLCPFHHRGLLPTGYNAQQMSGLVGPSLTWGSKIFASFFCRDDGLLEVQNLILEEFEKSPWHNYDPHYEVCRKARLLWDKHR